MIIEIKNLIKNYADEEVATPALCGVSFSVKQGEFVAIMGASGSGKSTLMHIIGFLDRLTQGEYFFDGENTNEFDDVKLAQIRNQKVGFIFQSYNLLPRLSVLDNVLLPTVYAHNVSEQLAKKKALALLKRIGLSHRIDHRPNQLSGGEQQRAAIVRALINKPRLILADEPTGNLDSHSGREVMEILQGLNEQGNTIVMVTHESDVARCTKRIITLLDGKIISDEKVAKQRIAKDDGIFK